jgi:hypothetical protein
VGNVPERPAADFRSDSSEVGEIQGTRAGIFTQAGKTYVEAGKVGGEMLTEMAAAGLVLRFSRVLGLTIGDDAVKIARGHAWKKHGNEFSAIGIHSERQFARHIESVMKNPTAIRNLDRGRVAFWDQRSGTVVIRDPSSSDGGTAFIPRRGVSYFHGLR